MKRSILVRTVETRDGEVCTTRHDAKTSVKKTPISHPSALGGNVEHRVTFTKKCPFNPLFHSSFQIIKESTTEHKDLP